MRTGDLAQPGLLGLDTVLYPLCVARIVILDSIVFYRAKRYANRSNSHVWLGVARTL
jgi:hypothetical protein